MRYITPVDIKYRLNKLDLSLIYALLLMLKYGKKSGVMMRFILLLALVFAFAEAIITVKPTVIGKNPGISGALEGSFQTKRGNTDKDEYSLGLKMQYDNNRTYTAFANIIGSYGEVSGVRNTNKTYAHMRFIHSLYGNFNYELYLQSETNEFTSVDMRRLGGAGIRYHLAEDKYGDLFFGIGLYYEDITYTTLVDPNEHNTRINSYIAYTLDISDTTKFAYVGYYQPKVDDMGDFITSNAIELKINIYEKLNLKLRMFYDYDGHPAVGREKTDFTQITSFSYDF